MSAMNLQTSRLSLVTHSTSSSQARTGKYRRNGQLQSCEPCRKSKLRCDHVVPVCQRCIKRRRGEQCVYISNPLAKSRLSPRVERPTPSTVTADQDSPSIVPSVEIDCTRSVQEPPPTSATAVQRHRAASAPLLHARCETAPPSHNPGFLGATSFSCIFADLDNLGIVSDVEAQGRHILVTHDHMVQSCEVLSFLKDKSMINRFVSRMFEIGSGASNVCIEPIMKQWLLKLGVQYGDVLRRQEPAKIFRLSETIWRNTRSPLVFDGSTSPMDWAALGTGPNIRWEVIGLIAAVAGVCASTLEPSDSFLTKTGVSGLDFARRMRGFASTCLRFCQDCETMNDMFLWLVCEIACLDRALDGDNNYAYYRATGDEVNVVITMGLHQKVEANEQVPFFLAETRKFIFTAIYSSEIGISAFLGRPPRLSYHYCTLDPPLDLTEAQLMLEKDEIAAVINSLDKDGYNTVGRIGRATRIRLWIELACRKEDIVDLALGQHTRDEVVRRAKVIQNKMEKHWASLPSFIRKIRDVPVELHSSTLKPYERLINFYISQGPRGNELLLQRVLIRKAGASSEKLIQEARAMIKDVLHLCQRFDVASWYMMDVNSVLVIHGLRSAAIVAVELLKQEQLPYLDSALLPRSQTIQDLSIFAARLGSVDPRDGSFAICDQGRKVIQRILDKILSPLNAGDRGHVDRRPQWDGVQLSTEQLNASAVSSGPLRNPLSTPEVSTTAMDIDFGFDAPYLGHDRDFMQWLENVNWDHPEAWNIF